MRRCLEPSNATCWQNNDIIPWVPQFFLGYYSWGKFGEDEVKLHLVPSAFYKYDPLSFHIFLCFRNRPSWPRLDLSSSGGLRVATNAGQWPAGSSPPWDWTGNTRGIEGATKLKNCSGSFGSLDQETTTATRQEEKVDKMRKQRNMMYILLFYALSSFLEEIYPGISLNLSLLYFP